MEELVQVQILEILVHVIICHLLISQIHLYSERTVYLEESMSCISLSQPERSTFGYVHVGGFHHTLIDPVKHM